MRLYYYGVGTAINNLCNKLMDNITKKKTKALQQTTNKGLWLWNRDWSDLSDFKESIEESQEKKRRDTK